MQSLFSRQLADDAEIRRVEMLFDGWLSGVVVSLIGFFFAYWCCSTAPVYRC